MIYPSGRNIRFLTNCLEYQSSVPFSVVKIYKNNLLPGLPLKIASPEFEVHLLESKARKVGFLKDMIRKLGLKGIEAYKGRAEKKVDLPQLFHSYDIVTARALASLKKTISICSTYLEQGGLLVTFKGSRVDQEIEDSEKLMVELNVKISKKIFYSLPETEGKRYLLILKKGET